MKNINKSIINKIKESFNTLMGKGQRADLALAAECSFEKRKKLWLDSLEHLPLKKEQNKPVFILL